MFGDVQFNFVQEIGGQNFLCFNFWTKIISTFCGNRCSFCHSISITRWAETKDVCPRFVFFVCQSSEMPLGCSWQRSSAQTRVVHNVCLMMPHFNAHRVIVCNVILGLGASVFGHTVGHDKNSPNNRRCSDCWPYMVPYVLPLNFMSRRCEDRKAEIWFTVV